MDEAKISSQAVQEHLKIESCSGTSYCIKRKPYSSVVKELEAISKKLPDGAKIWVRIQS